MKVPSFRELDDALTLSATKLVNAPKKLVDLATKIQKVPIIGPIIQSGINSIPELAVALEGAKEFADVQKVLKEHLGIDLNSYAHDIDAYLFGKEASRINSNTGNSPNNAPAPSYQSGIGVTAPSFNYHSFVSYLPSNQTLVAQT